MSTAPWNVSAAGDPAVTRLRRLSDLFFVPGVVTISVVAIDNGSRVLWFVGMSLVAVGLGLSAAAANTQRRIQHAIWRSGATTSGAAPPPR